MKKTLFIAEKSILDSSICYNNDVNLLLESLRQNNSDIYLANPENIISSHDKNFIYSQIITINNLQKIEKIKKEFYLKSSLYMLFSLSVPKKLKKNSIINPFLSKKKIKINKSNIDIVIDRAEPVSRTGQYYDAIFNLKDKKYFDDPIFRQNESDKEIVVKIDQELTKKKQYNLGFKTQLIDFKEENNLIKDKNRHKLYQIFQNISENDQKNNILSHFPNIKDPEKSAIISIIQKISNFQIDFDYFCIKPSNWYGGVAVELIGNKRRQISNKFSKKDLFYKIAKIHQNILEDVKKNYQNQDLILKRAILNGIIIQEQVCYPEFGDLRIFVSFGKIQGVILRVPAKNNNIANMSAGGHAEIFINPVNKSQKDLDILQQELKKLGQGEIFTAIMDLITNIQNSLETNIGKDLKKSAFIGFDALLDINLNDNNEKKYFSCNEINLSSAMGQNQIEIANLLENLLENNKIYKILLKNLKYPSSQEEQEFICAFSRFLIFKQMTVNLTDIEKYNLIDELYLQIKDIKTNIISIANHTINKIING